MMPIGEATQVRTPKSPFARGSMMVAFALAATYAGPALGADECGLPKDGAVVCFGGDYTTGINYTTANGHTLTLSGSTINASRSNAGATGAVVGVVGSAGNTGNIVVKAANFNSVIGTGATGRGIAAENNGTAGDAIVTMDTGLVQLLGPRPLYAGIGSSGTGAAKITLNGGTVISTNPFGGLGLNALNEGSGNAEVVVNGGTMEARPNGRYAISNITNPASTATSSVVINGGTFTNPTATGGGAGAANGGLGDSVVRMTGGSLTTPGTGFFAHGLEAQTNNAASAATALVWLENGTVATTGANGAALSSVTSGTGTAAVRMDGGSASALGSNSDGIFARATTTGKFAVNITGGGLTGGSGNGASIHTGAKAGGTLEIGAGATINAGGSGVAIRDGDLDRNGTDEIKGAINLTTAGTLNGVIVLGDGNDVVNITGGAINGNITGGGAAKLNFNLGGGSFTYGAPFAITGMDEVTMASGLAQIDGSLATNTLTVNGGMLVLNGAPSATTGATIFGGTLAVGDDAHPAAVLTGSVEVLAAGRLQGIGTIAGNVANAGVIAPGNSIGTLTVAGNYTGNNGRLEIETALGGDASPTDRLVVTGDTAGSTNVKVINVGGTGAPTVEGIKVVDVGGASNGAFALQGNFVHKGEQAVIGGAYAYTLHQGGASTPSDGDWYLRSEFVNPVTNVPEGPLFQPGVALYEAYPQILLGLMRMSSLRERSGNRYGSGVVGYTSVAASDDDGMSYLGGPAARGYGDIPPAYGDVTRAWWGRLDASRISIEPSSSTAGATYDADQVRLQTGVEGIVYTDGGGKLLAGFTVQHGTSWAHVHSVWGNGKINVEGYGIGGTLTWYDASGFYVDTQAQVNWFDTDIRSSLAGTMTEGDDTVGYGISLETGKRFSAGGPWALTPQAQLAYTRADLDFTDTFGAAVSGQDGDSLLGRLGLALDYRDAWMGGRSHVYGIANLYYEFLDGTSVDVAGVRFRSEKDELWGGLGLGGTYSWGADKYALFGEVSVNTGLDNFGDSYGVNGTAGFRVRW